MPAEDLRIAEVAPGRPYHAALAWLPARRAAADLHGHADFCELMYITAGRGTHRLERASQDLEAGQIVLARPCDRHGFLASPPVGIELINVAFPAIAWRTFLHIAEVDDTAVQAGDRLPPEVTLTGDHATRAEAAFRRALGRFQDSPTTFDLIGLWVEVVPLLLGEKRRPDDAMRPSWLVHACAAMHQEDNLREGLPRMLELAAVSHGHLARCMRQHHGVTPVTFITDLRLRHAADLLTTTSQSVGEISRRCGFSSQSYFAHCFGRVYGTAPRTFRERARRSAIP